MTTNTREKAISLATRREIQYDINNGLFSDSSMANNKYYRDEENDIDIEVETEFIDWRGCWRFDIKIFDDFGEEYTLEGGQWDILNNAFEEDIEWREHEAHSEAKHLEYLWRECI